MSRSRVTDRPRKPVAELVETTDTLFITLKTRRGSERFRGVFLVVFLLFWTYGCAAFVAMIIKTAQYPLLFVALMIWGIWGLLVYAISKIYFGEEHLAVSRAGIDCERKIFRTFGRRHISRSEILSVRTAPQPVQITWPGHAGIIKIETTGTSSHFFGTGLSREEYDWLAQKIREALQLPDAGESPRASGVRRDTCVIEPSAIQQPVDSEWTLEDDGLSLRWLNAGRFRGNLMFGSLIMNLMWNGFLVFFISTLVGGVGPGRANKPLNGGGGWCLIAFLVPFVFQGAVVFFGLIKTIMEPYRRTVWTFHPAVIERQDHWPGWHRTKRFSVGEDCRLAVREKIRKMSRSARKMLQLMPRNQPFELVVLDRDVTPVCGIGPMTRGDARWMREEIESRRPGWFKRVEPPA